MMIFQYSFSPNVKWCEALETSPRVRWTNTILTSNGDKTSVSRGRWASRRSRCPGGPVLQLVHVHENSEAHNVYGCPLKSFSLDGARFIDAVAPTTCERAVRANSGAGQPQNEHLDYSIGKQLVY